MVYWPTEMCKAKFRMTRSIEDKDGLPTPSADERQGIPIDINYPPCSSGNCVKRGCYIAIGGQKECDWTCA